MKELSFPVATCHALSRTASRWGGHFVMASTVDSAQSGTLHNKFPGCSSLSIAIC